VLKVNLPMRSRESDEKVFLKWPEFNPIPNGLDEGVTVRAFWKSILVSHERGANHERVHKGTCRLPDGIVYSFTINRETIEKSKTYSLSEMVRIEIKSIIPDL